MKLMTEWEEVTPKLKKRHRNRIIACVIYILLLIFVFSSAVKDPTDDSSFNVFMFATMGFGFLHIPEIRSKLKVLLVFPIIGWGIWFVAAGFCSFFAGLYLIPDIIKLIMRKPLIYKMDIETETLEEEAELLAAEREADSKRVYIVQPAGYCSKCGSPYAAQSVVCANCGAKVGNQNPENQM